MSGAEEDGLKREDIARSWQAHIKSNEDPFRIQPGGIYDQIRNWLSVNSLSNKGLAILDVGCGQGITSEIAASQGAKVLGVDFSEPLIKIAQRNYSFNQNLTFATCNAANLAFENNSFDAASLINCLFHLDPDDMLGAIKELGRVVKPNGSIFITTINPDAYDEFAAAFANQKDFTFNKNEAFSYPTKKIVGDPAVAGSKGKKIILKNIPFVMHPWENIMMAIDAAGLKFKEKPFTFASLSLVGGPEKDLFLALELVSK